MRTSVLFGAPVRLVSWLPGKIFISVETMPGSFTSDCSHDPEDIRDLQVLLDRLARPGSDRGSSVNMTACVIVPSSEHVAEIVGRQGEFRFTCSEIKGRTSKGKQSKDQRDLPTVSTVSLVPFLLFSVF